MAPWKTSTAGSARSTSTSSNRRQACLKAALRGGFLISPSLPAQTARYRSTQLATASPYELRYALAWQRSVRNQKKRTPTPCNFARSGWKRLHSKSVNAFEFAPNECPHLFIPKTPHRKAHTSTKPPNEITPSLMVSKLYVFQQRVKEHAAERRPGNKKRATPKGGSAIDCAYANLIYPTSWGRPSGQP